MKGTHCGRRVIPSDAPIDSLAGTTARSGAVARTPGVGPSPVCAFPFAAPRPVRLRGGNGAGVSAPAPFVYRGHLYPGHLYPGHLVDRLAERLGPGERTGLMAPGRWTRLVVRSNDDRRTAPPVMGTREAYGDDPHGH
jgi:hypothetical protein